MCLLRYLLTTGQYFWANANVFWSSDGLHRYVGLSTSFPLGSAPLVFHVRTCVYAHTVLVRSSIFYSLSSSDCQFPGGLLFEMAMFALIDYTVVVWRLYCTSLQHALSQIMAQINLCGLFCMYPGLLQLFPFLHMKEITLFGEKIIIIKKKWQKSEDTGLHMI